MIIRKTRVINLIPYIDFIAAATSVIFGCRIRHISDNLLYSIGFSQNPSIGQSILPAAVFGPVSHYNSEGKYLVHRDKPKETAYRQVEWHWREWRGRYDSEDQSKIVDVPYRRYPRTFIPPPSIEFVVVKLADGENALAAHPIKLEQANMKLALHIVNLFLEITKECEIFSENLEGIFKIPLIRLNWEILPPGRYPWSQLKPKVDELIRLAPEGNHSVIAHRFEEINRYNPEFHAIGRAGFRGYIIFGFSNKNLYILESIYFGNATYVFDKDWEELSQKTKAEILDSSLQKDRIIHRQGWEQRLNNSLK